MRETETVPAVNQVELHPRFPQEALRAYHAEHGILTEAWSPIGRGRGLLEDQTIIRLAAEKQRSPAQVVLRWHMQLGNIAIPKSVTPARIRQNIDIFDFTLDEGPDAAAEPPGHRRADRPGPRHLQHLLTPERKRQAHTARPPARHSGSSGSSSSRQSSPAPTSPRCSPPCQPRPALYEFILVKPERVAATWPPRQ
jgi:hypothetical protein